MTVTESVIAKGQSLRSVQRAIEEVAIAGGFKTTGFNDVGVVYEKIIERNDGGESVTRLYARKDGVKSYKAIRETEHKQANTKSQTPAQAQSPRKPKSENVEEKEKKCHQE